MGNINKIFERIKDTINKQNKRKIIENCAISIIIGIIMMVAGGTLFRGTSKDTIKTEETNLNKSSAEVSKIFDNDPVSQTEELETILSKIKGVGKVNVMVTYEESKEKIPAYDVKKNSNTTSEKDTGGGVRTIDQDDYDSKLVYEDAQEGGKKPIILKELQPKVKGVIVVSDGATDVIVKEALSEAIQVLMDIPIHKVQIFERIK